MDQATRYQDLQLGKWLAGAAVGAIAMYMLDPERGAPRRAASGEKLRQLGRQAGSAVDQVVHDMGSSLDGAAQAVRGAAGKAGALAREATAQAMAAVPALAGGAGGVNHDSDARNWHTGAAGAGNGAAGAGTPASSHTPSHTQVDMQSQTSSLMPVNMQSTMPSLMQSLMHLLQPGGARAVGIDKAALAGGGMLGLYGLFARRSPLAIVAGLAGLVLMARGAGRAPGAGMASAGSLMRPVNIEKTIRIDAPPEQVYDLFASYENFPRFMSNVIEVRDLGDDRSHWVVKGPAGTHFQWNAVLTEQSRPRRLAWQSEPGAEVEQTGSILFEPFRNGTRVTVHMSYQPPAGAVGQAIAALFGSDPKRQMDRDLARMKSLLERGAIQAAPKRSSGLGKILH